MAPSGHGGKNLAEAIRVAYREGQTDYSMAPLVLEDETGTPVGTVKSGDAVIFCCRRGEREVELTDAFTASDFPHFPREKLKDLDFVILTMYHEKYKNMPIAFAPHSIEMPLAHCISQAGMKQLHLAESEKYAQVTYFFNGGHNQAFPGEDDICVPSPKGVPFDTVPQLSLPSVAEKVKGGIAKEYDFIVVNFANGDVIGHTSNFQSKVECAACVDRHLGEVVRIAEDNNYVVLITADHGNLEVAYTKEGKPYVAHTANLVPFFIIDPKAGAAIHPNQGSLQDVAPTILQVLNLQKPAVMSGTSLVPGYNFGQKRKVLLVILDGWGIGEENDSNPIYKADTPFWNALCSTYPMAQLRASGSAVWLQEGKAGNSEAGHMNIGAGRVVMQDDVRLDTAMKDGSFQKNPVLRTTIQKAAQRGAALHLLTLLSKKSSHGSVDYPLALLRMAKDEGLSKVYLHVILDGRSTEPGSAPALLEELDAQLAEIGIGTIVDCVGRGIALDRDGNYQKIQQAYEGMVLGKGKRYR